MRLLLAFLLISCAAKVKLLINEGSFEPSKYKCSAGKIDANKYMVVSDSVFLHKVKFLQWCLSVGAVDGSFLNLPPEKLKVLNAAEIGLVCEDGELISNEFILVDRLFLYRINRASEMCMGNSYIVDEPEQSAI